MRRRWSGLSVGRAAVLSRKGASREEIVKHYFKHYAKKWGVKTKEEMNNILFERPGGRTKKPGLLFEAKTPEQIDQAFKNWLEKETKARAKMAAAQKGKKRGPLTPETRAKIAAALTGKKRGSPTLEARAKMAAGRKLSWARVKGEILRLERARGLITKPRETIESRALKGRKLVPATRETPLTTAIELEQLQALQQAVRQLTPLQQQVIEQTFYSNQSIEETAAKLEKTVKQTRQAYNAALRKLAGNKKLAELMKLEE